MRKTRTWKITTGAKHSRPMTLKQALETLARANGRQARIVPVSS